MVNIIFKLNETGSVKVKLNRPETLRTVLYKCTEESGVKLGGYIAVRDGKVVAAKDQIDVNDTILVFPAISGG